MAADAQPLARLSNMSYLLLPEDERELVEYLCYEIGLSLLLSDVAPNGIPSVARNPTAVLPSELPDRVQVGKAQVAYFIFWCPSICPVHTIAQKSATTDPKDRVSEFLTRNNAGGRYPDVIDLSATPVIRYRRCYWQTTNRLVPGVLQAMPIRIPETPNEVLQLYRKVERWLRKRGTKLNPFEHCLDTPVPQPRNLNGFWVWAQPHALEWVRNNGEIWPWTA